MAGGRFVLRYGDYDSEVSTVTFPTDVLTAGNFDQEATDRLALQNALADVVIGKLLQTTAVATTSPHGVGGSANPLAQRELKALVHYYDSITFERATLEIPCPDLSKQNPDYPGLFYLAGAANNHADWETFVTAFATLTPGPGGNTAVVERIESVGRNI